MCYDINIDAYVGATYPGIMVCQPQKPKSRRPTCKGAGGRWWILRRALERKWAYQYGRLAVDGPILTEPSAVPSGPARRRLRLTGRERLLSGTGLKRTQPTTRSGSRHRLARRSDSASCSAKPHYRATSRAPNGFLVLMAAGFAVVLRCAGNGKLPPHSEPRTSERGCLSKFGATGRRRACPQCGWDRAGCASSPYPGARP